MPSELSVSGFRSCIESSAPVAPHSLVRIRLPAARHGTGEARDGKRDDRSDGRAARLRGQPSYGTIDHGVDPAWEVGRDVQDHYGVTKFEPPLRASDGDSLPSVAAFHGYTEIENIRNFPDVLRPGEEVVISEKLHGKNCRVGLIRVPGDGGDAF